MTGTLPPATAEPGHRQAQAEGAPRPSYDAWRRRRSSFTLVMIVLAVAVVVSLTLSLGIGPVQIAPGDVWRIVAHQLAPNLVDPDWAPVQQKILLEVRLPRVLLGAVVGAGLSVVGATLQALVRNPLADPHIVGITAGASVGATAVLLMGFSPFGVYSLSVAAFAGGLGSLLLVYVLAQRSRRLSAMRLILAGVAISYLLSATTSFLIFEAATDGGGATRLVVFWLLGGLGSAQWPLLGLPAAAVLLGTVFLVLQSRRLDALLVGEETAASLGVDTSRFRKQLFVLSAFVAGVLVAVSGGIGFVGLMMPHVVRLLVGSSHRRVLPAAALLGAAFLVWADVLARVLFAPEELPIGIITAFCGAPFFIWLMRSQRSGRGRGALA